MSGEANLPSEADADNKKGGALTMSNFIYAPDENPLGTIEL